MNLNVQRSFPKGLRIILMIFLYHLSVSAYSQLLPGFKVNDVPVNQGDTVITCVGTRLIFQSTAQGYSSIRWRFNNGTGGSLNSTTQIIDYNKAGMDTAWQVVTDFNNDKDSMFVLVRVNSTKPVPKFSFSPNDKCANEPITFTNSSTGNGLSYHWNFGDATGLIPAGTSTQTSPSYQFLNAVGASGTQDYTVKLVVTNNQNCKDSITQKVTVLKVPDASIRSANPGVIEYQVFNGVPTFKRCENASSYNFSFYNATTTPTNITGYTIKWGDGRPDSSFTTWPDGVAINHTYSLGQHTMEVSVRGTNGCIGIKRYNVFLGTNPAGGIASRGNTSICAPNALTFDLSSTENNAPGTTYTFSINDGSEPVVFQQPPPKSVTHNFLIGSCGTSSSNGSQVFSNSFRANLYVENPCGSTAGTVIPIYVSGKPRASIGVSPSTSVCVNTTATIFNTSAFGGVVTQTGGGNSICSNTGKQVWVISPATGYTLTSGSLGSLNSNPTNGAAWTAGSSAIYPRFTVPGTYTVKIYIANELCGMDSTTRVICVRNPPTASFTMDKKEGCAPQVVNFTNTSPSPTCGSNTYHWSVSYADPSDCGGTSGYSFTNNTNASSISPQIQFTNPGRYVITLTASATASNCSSGIFRDTFYVKSKPKITLPDPSPVCLGNAITPSATVNNCYSSGTLTYNWSFAGGSPANAATVNPGSVTFATIGTHVIQLEAGNECGTTTTTADAVITALPTANAGADLSICSGASANIGTSSTGYTYSWAPATGLSSSTAASPSLTLDYSGPSADTTIRYVLTVSAGSNCTSTDTVFVTVKKRPSVSVSPANASVCAGSSATLTASGADTYTWIPASGLNVVSGASVIATPGSTTTYTVTGTQNGCTSTASTSVSVTPFVAVDAGKDSSVCNTATAVQLVGSPSGGVWSGSPFVNAAGVFNAQSAGNGSYKLYYTAGTGNCTKSDSIVVTVINPPLVAAGNDTTVCQGNTPIILTGTPAGGRWSGSPYIGADGSFMPTAPGTYNLVYTFGAGTCMQTDAIQVTVIGGIQNNTITGASSICAGAVPGILNGSVASGGAETPKYQWQQSVDGTNWENINGAQDQNYVPPALTTARWYRRLASTTLCSGPQNSISNTVSIQINGDAQAVFNPTKEIGCPPFSLTPAIINLTPFNDRVSEYRWYVDGTYIGSGETFPGYTIQNPSASSTVKLVAISRYGCKNDSLEKTFTTLAIPVPSFTADVTEGCGPLTVRFTNTTPNASSHTYLWEFGNGRTSTDVQPGLITFLPHPLNLDTTYTVLFKTITACDTIVLQKQVTVHSGPKALFTPDKSTGCSPMNVQFSNISRGLNNTYSWNFGDGSPILTSNDATVSHTFTVSRRDTFHVQLTATNSCGTDRLTYDIIVSPNQIQLDFAVNGTEQKGCSPHAVNFINNTRGATSFQWDFGDGTSRVTTKNIDTVSHRYLNPGNYVVRLTATNGCSDTTTTETISVYESPESGFHINASSLCIGDTIRFTNQSKKATDYLWSFGDGTISSLLNPEHHFVRPGVYSVRLVALRPHVDGGSCTDTTIQTVTVSSTAQGAVQLSDTVGSCSPFTVHFSNQNLPAQSITWDFGDGSTANTNDASHTYTVAGNYLVKATAIAPGGCTYITEKLIQVKGPSGSFAYEAGFHCGKTPVRFSVTSNGTDSIIYDFGDGSILRTTSNLVFHTYRNAGAYLPSIVLKNLEGCTVPIKGTDSVKVDIIQAGFSVAQNKICGSTEVQFSDTSFAYYGKSRLTWNLGDAGTSNASSVNRTYTAGGTYTISLSVKSNSGCEETVTTPVAIQVFDIPVAGIKADAESCSDYTVLLRGDIQSTDAIQMTQWKLSNGITGTTNPFPVKFTTAGTYTATLMTGTVNGCYDTVQHSITIKPSPIVVASNDATICLGSSVSLQAGGAAQLSWLPTTGLSCTACSNVVASPSATTSYVVQGTNVNGCSDWDTVLVEVIQPLRLTVSPTDSICIGQGSQLLASGASSYSWSPADALSSTNIPNPTAKPSATVRYRVVGYDGYNCFTDTAYILVAVGEYPKISLGPDLTLATGTLHPLQSAIQNGPIRRWEWNPATDLNCAACPRPVATVKKDISYIATVTNNYGCSASDTIAIKAFCEDAQVFVPNAFTPDGDGINDVLMVRGKGIAMVKTFRVFNRWGEVVFEKSGFAPNNLSHGWDGKIKGVIGGPDVYVYTVEAICENGTTYSYKGNVSLIK